MNIDRILPQISVLVAELWTLYQWGERRHRGACMKKGILKNLSHFNLRNFLKQWFSIGNPSFSSSICITAFLSGGKKKSIFINEEEQIL